MKQSRAQENRDTPNHESDSRSHRHRDPRHSTRDGNSPRSARPRSHPASRNGVPEFRSLIQAFLQEASIFGTEEPVLSRPRKSPRSLRATHIQSSPKQHFQNASCHARQLFRKTSMTIPSCHRTVKDCDACDDVMVTIILSNLLPDGKCNLTFFDVLNNQATKTRLLRCCSPTYHPYFCQSSGHSLRWGSD